MIQIFYEYRMFSRNRRYLKNSENNLSCRKEKGLSHLSTHIYKWWVHNLNIQANQALCCPARLPWGTGCLLAELSSATLGETARPHAPPPPNSSLSLRLKGIPLSYSSLLTWQPDSCFLWNSEIKPVTVL